MTIEHHDLGHEFPELRERIHELKVTDNHFRKLLEAYQQLTKDVENMETDVNVVATNTEEEAKKRLVYLQDQLYRMLTA